MRKIVLIILLVCALLSISGCKKNSNKLKYIDCDINSTATDNIKIDRKYRIYYTDNLVNKTESNDIVTSNDSALITKYSNAYQQVAEAYKDIKYYDFTVKTSSNKVHSRIVIDYDHVDVDKILEIEGEEDNIFTDKKVYLDKLKEWAKNHGINCDKN